MIILGAGISALKAAQELVFQHGFSAPGQVILLEASQHVGGRMRTDRSLGYAVDMGATWVHGVDGNPIADLANSIGAPMAQSNWESLEVYRRDGSRIPNRQLRLSSARVKLSYQRAQAHAHAQVSDLSMADALDATGAWNLFGPAERETAHFLYGEMVEELVCYLQDYSAKSWYSDGYFGGGDWLFPQGFDALPASMAPGLDIRLGHTVQAVDLNPGGVTVTTDQGAFQAEHCICTLPLGVLKAGSVNFNPGLPARIQHSVDALHFGNRHRLLMEFPQVFWNPNVEFLGKVGRPYARYGAGENLLIVNRAGLYGRPVISVETIQDFGNQQETDVLQNSIDRALTELRRIYGPAVVPQPVSVLSSDWGSNPLFHGSYSGWAPGANWRTNAAFLQPVQGRLHFAGEHCNPRFPSTVHGAFLSGFKTARAVKQLAN